MYASPTRALSCHQQTHVYSPISHVNAFKGTKRTVLLPVSMLKYRINDITDCNPTIMSYPLSQNKLDGHPSSFLDLFSRTTWVYYSSEKCRTSYNQPVIPITNNTKFISYYGDYNKQQLSSS